VPEAKYRQIADELGEMIASGRLGPGGRLPTEDQLSRQFTASRNTVRDAVKWLINRGLVETRPGQGTFVVEPAVPFVTTLSGDWQEDAGLGGGEGTAARKEAQARGRTTRLSSLVVEVRRAHGFVADRLRIDVGASVVTRHQKRYIDEQPWSLQTSFYPMDLVARGAGQLLQASEVDEGTVSYLRATLQLKQAGYQDTILVRAPDESEASFFHLPPNGHIAVMVLLRTGFAAGPDGPVPFRLTESIFPGDRNQFVINAGDVPDHLANPVEA
jgi:GntR family transcriptional regulator